MMESLKTVYQQKLKDFQKRKNNELTILLYHGVTNSISKGIENHAGKHMEEKNFAKQMKYIRNKCSPISIDEYLFYCENKTDLPPNSVVVSFDDGFKNNYSVAAPILDEFQIPAVFYISSGVVNTNMMFWVDVLEDCINLTKKPYINVYLNEKVEFFIDTYEQKIAALNSIKAYCKTRPYFDTRRVLEDIQVATGITPQVDHAENYKKITWDELKVMNDNSLFVIGGHSLYHNILSQLDANMLDKEIRSSLDLLEINLQTSIYHYSYPEGQKNHYNSSVINVLKKYGVVCSPSAVPGLNPIDTDPFHLKRIMVGFSELPFPYLDTSL